MARNWGRILLVGFLAFVLVTSLVAANLVVGVDRTALDSEFVKDSLEEEDAYEVMIDQMGAELAPDTGGEDVPEGSPTPEEIVTNVLTEEYVQEQAEQNIDWLYAYLHGDRDDLYLAIETEPLKDDIAEEIAASLVENFDFTEIDPQFARMMESEEEFETVRDEFEAEQKTRIQEETSRELSEEELDQAYDENRDQIRELALGEIDSEISDADYPAELDPVLEETATLYVDALVSEDMTYDEFMDGVDSAEESLEEAATEAARNQIDEELPDTVVVTEDMSEQELSEFETIREAVSVLSTLAIVLPIFAILVALLISWITVTRSAGFMVVGGASAVSGGIIIGGITVIEDLITAEIETAATQGDIPMEMVEVVMGILSSILNTFLFQSWILVGFGILLVVGGYAIRKELLPITDVPGDDQPEDVDETDSNVDDGGEEDGEAGGEEDGEAGGEGDGGDAEDETPGGGASSDESGID